MNNKKKIFLVVSIGIVSIILLIGVTYAAMSYSKTSVNQQLVLGDIWMSYEETGGLSISDALPGSDYSNYFEFTISGKNTYTKKDIYYDFILVRGDLPEGKTEENRIPDKYLKFKLVSVDDSNQETILLEDETYESFENKRIYVETIEKNTENVVNRKYRLYMTIDYSLEIGNSETAVFTLDEWESAFASVKLNVTGDFNEKELPVEPINWFDEVVLNKNTESCPTYVKEDGITYISGHKNCVNFNYVWSSGKLWRITVIYPDGTMKMVTDGLMTTIAYGADNKFYTDENTTSYMYQWLNQEFLPTLYNYENIIVEDAIWNASPRKREISIDGQEEVLITSTVGLLNSYEYYKSYQNNVYQNGYLNNGYTWWLLNPYSDSSLEVNYVDYPGDLGYGEESDYMYGVRPSIKLKSTIQLTGGTGTVNDPYRLNGDKENIEENVTLINTRQSGEYVKVIDEETAPTFRIVGTEIINGATSTKLVLNDYVRDTNDVDADSDTTEVLTREFGPSASWSSVSETDPTYWRGYLNNTWIKEIDPTYNSETGTFGMIEKGTYYLGTVVWDDNDNNYYKLAVCKTANNIKSVQDCIDENTEETPTIQASVMEYSGLPRYGEMFASQFGTDYRNSSNMWLITAINSVNSRRLSEVNMASSSGVSAAYSARPSINLKSTLVIKSGSGTKQDPFVVGLPS